MCDGRIFDGVNGFGREVATSYVHISVSELPELSSCLSSSMPLVLS